MPSPHVILPCVILSGAKQSRRILAPPIVERVMVMSVVYILSNWDDSVLYIGVTSNLPKRLYEHRNGLVEGFTKKYDLHKLVYYEEASYMRSAIEREKQLKGWTRAKKNALIQSTNPPWRDLSSDWD